MIRRSYYWDEFSDEDLEYRKKSFEALIRNCEYEVETIERELEKRREYDTQKHV